MTKETENQLKELNSKPKKRLRNIPDFWATLYAALTEEERKEIEKQFCIVEEKCVNIFPHEFC